MERGMSDLHYQVPCGDCRQYYGHHDKCSIHAESGIFEKLVIKRQDEMFSRKHQNLIEKTKKLEEINKQAIEVIEFYASLDNWDCGVNLSKYHDQIDDDFCKVEFRTDEHIDSRDDYFAEVGGKRARKFLESIK